MRQIAEAVRTCPSVSKADLPQEAARADRRVVLGDVNVAGADEKSLAADFALAEQHVAGGKIARCMNGRSHS